MRFLLKSIGVILWFLVVVIVWSNVIIVSSSSHYIVDSIEELPTNTSFQTVITPWAAVFDDGRLSSVTRGRVMGSIQLYKQWIVPTILVSWDNWTRQYNEVRAMRNYINKKWIDKSVIFQDFAWFDTYDTMYRAHELFEVEMAVISTQEFHLYRAVYLARALWIDARWVKAWWYQPRRRDKMMFREHLARVKARGEITFWSSPKFLGDHVPIDWESNGWVG